tara:strand:+ start:110 stop:295 length:186 start_codon:yes stop_codon:yes gene_type:complete
MSGVTEMIHDEKRTILQRLELIKDIDSAYSRLLNDSYIYILQQEKRIDMLENQLYELNGSK